jgi:hypothetical protein
MGIFTKMIEQGRTGVDKTGFIKPGTLDARDWYREKAREVRSVNPAKIISQNTKYNRNQIRPGFMYLFGYDPKTKEDLPYYDKFPLIFPFESMEGGFLGMNLHYLPPLMRARLMDNLYDLVNNERFDETTKIKASYNFLNSAARYKYFKPCIKRYLNSHVMTKFLLIPASEWDVALFLPLERFQKENKNTVYRESRRIINGV